MLDADFVRNNLGCVRAMIEARNGDPEKVLRDFQHVDAMRREALQGLQALQAERNRLAEEIRELKGQGVAALVERARQVKAEIPLAQKQADELDAEFQDIMAGIPNMPQGFYETYQHDAAVARVSLLEEICEEIKREQDAALRPLPQEV